MYKGVVVVLILVVITAGCVGGGGQSGNGNQGSQSGSGGGEGGGSGQASVSFSEETLDDFEGDPTQVIIKVQSIGSYDFVWVEVDNVNGGFRINESITGNQLFIRPNGYSSYGYCYKESVDSGCTDYEGDSEAFTNSAQVYGVEGGEKTLLEEYSPDG